MISLSPLIDYQIYATKFIIKWVISFIGKFVNWNDITNSVPIVNVLNFRDIITPEVYALICEWFPCSWAITCFVAYVTCAIIVYGVNWILGLIPTVS